MNPEQEESLADVRAKLTADDYRRLSRDAILTYLRDTVTVEERKDVFKAALNEWLKDRFSEFGWFSFKALAAMIFFVVMTLWLYMNGWHK